MIDQDKTELTFNTNTIIFNTKSKTFSTDLRLKNIIYSF